MNRFAAIVCSMLGALHLPGALAQGSAANGCEGFRRDVTRELALMRQAATAVGATAEGGTGVAPLALARHYSVTLLPQEQVHFAVAPAHPSRDAAPRGASL